LPVSLKNICLQLKKTIYQNRLYSVQRRLNMEELVVMTGAQLETLLEKAVVKGVERVRPMLLRAAHEHVTLQEAVKIYPFTKRQLDYWRKCGEGPAYHLIGNVVSYKVSDLEEWYQKFRVEPLY